MKKKTPKTIKKIKKQINRLAKELEKSQVKFKMLSHKVVYTAHDLAQTTKRKVGEIAKVVLVKSEKGVALVIVPAGKYVDFKAVQKTLKVKKLSIANEADIKKYLKTKIGLLHPFGNIYKVPTLIDKGFSKAKKFVAAAESYTDSVEVALKDFEKLVQPIKGAFGKNKK